jgi:hypothetical protein
MSSRTKKNNVKTNQNNGQKKLLLWRNKLLLYPEQDISHNKLIIIARTSSYVISIKQSVRTNKNNCQNKILLQQ